MFSRRFLSVSSAASGWTTASVKRRSCVSGEVQVAFSQINIHGRFRLPLGLTFKQAWHCLHLILFWRASSTVGEMGLVTCMHPLSSSSPRIILVDGILLMLSVLFCCCCCWFSFTMVQLVQLLVLMLSSPRVTTNSVDEKKIGNYYFIVNFHLTHSKIQTKISQFLILLLWHFKHDCLFSPVCLL